MLFIIMFLIILDAVLIFIGVYFFIRAFHGHAYELVPTGSETEKYHQELLQTYKEYSNCNGLTEKYFDEYLNRYYYECSSTNATINDKRSEYIHRANFFTILVIIPLVLTFVLSYYVSINNELKETKIPIEKSEQVEKIIFINTPNDNNNEY